MPFYEFRDIHSGEVVESWFDAKLAPRIGERVQLEGRHLERLMSMPQTAKPGVQRAGLRLPNFPGRTFATEKKLQEYAKARDLEVMDDPAGAIQQVIASTQQFERERAAREAREQRAINRLAAQVARDL